MLEKEINRTTKERGRIVLLIFIMAIIAIGVAGMSLYVLYEASFEQQRARLIETAQGRARMVEAVARFDARYSANAVPGGSFAATLVQIEDAHARFSGFGKTGEFVMAKRDKDKIVFLLRHRHQDLDKPKPIPFQTHLAEPMRRALSGESGITVAPDYRGVITLAAYEPVDVLNLGIVVKIDLEEIREPFIRAGILTLIAAGLLIGVGVLLFMKISAPLLRKLEEKERAQRARLEKLVAERTAELRSLERELIDISEAERRKIGQDLHDSLGQQLAGIAYIARVLQKKLQESPHEAAEADHIADLTNKAIDLTRSLARGLSPVNMKELGFTAAVEELCYDMQRVFNIVCHLNLKGAVAIHNDSTATHLYFIILEAVNNAVKHGQAGIVNIDLISKKSALVVRVHDNGTGFDGTTKVARGLGLQIMKYRANFIGASLVIRRASEGGTIVLCNLPWKFSFPRQEPPQ